MNYIVVINHKGGVARLLCTTLDEAELVRTSFVNWGGMGYDINIERNGELI